MCAGITIGQLSRLVATYSPSIDFQCGLLVWLNAQSVIDGPARLLLAPEVLFCSLDRDMSEQELDLIQFAAGADAPEITARFRDPGGNVLGLYQQPG